VTFTFERLCKVYGWANCSIFEQFVPGAEKYQFIKLAPGGDFQGNIKVDILTGPKAAFRGTRAKVDARRVRPTPSVGIHAHPVDEALTLEEGLLPVFLKGKLSSGKFWESEVFIPHPYTFLMMKLFAFKDRLNDPNKEFGRYHALDLYSILATTCEEEWSQALEFKKRYANQPRVLEAGQLVSQYFSTLEHTGLIRLQESPYYRPQLQLHDFISALQELFPLANQTGAEEI
jgi:hypothetical protein